MQLDKKPDNIHIIEWQIANFSSSILDEDETLQSPISTAGNLYNTRWGLVIYPKGKKGYPHFLSCFLRRDSREKVGPETLRIEFEFSLVTFDGVQTFKELTRMEFKRRFCYGIPNYIKLEELFRRREFLLESDTLTLRCKIRRLPPKELPTAYYVLETIYPIETSSARLELDNFRSISKKDPEVWSITGSKDLLSLKVSMNQDDVSTEQVEEGAIRSEKPGNRESFLHIVMVKEKYENPVHVFCWVKLLNINFEISVDKEFSHLFPKVDQDEEWILPYFIDTENLRHNCVLNDTLYIDIDFTICDSQPTSLLDSKWKFLKSREDPKETMMKDLVHLHKTKKFSDVTLQVGNKMFLAHKSVLAARSPRFKELLMKKGDYCENRIEKIADVDECTMEIILKFIYTDRLESMNDKRCLVVYSAARKYKISSLHFKCAMLAKKNLSVNTVYRTLLIADMFGDSELKMAAIDFILEHQNI